MSKMIRALFIIPFFNDQKMTREPKREKKLFQQKSALENKIYVLLERMEI